MGALQRRQRLEPNERPGLNRLDGAVFEIPDRTTEDRHKNAVHKDENIFRDPSPVNAPEEMTEMLL